MKILNILKLIGVIAGQAAPAIITAINPPLGVLVGTVLNAVLAAEAQHGSGNGPAKHDTAVRSLAISSGLIVSMVEGATGRTLVDEAVLNAGIEKLVDGMVDVLNAFRVLPKAS